MLLLLPKHKDFPEFEDFMHQYWFNYYCHNYYVLLIILSSNIKWEITNYSNYSKDLYSFNEFLIVIGSRNSLFSTKYLKSFLSLTTAFQGLMGCWILAYRWLEVSRIITLWVFYLRIANLFKLLVLFIFASEPIQSSWKYAPWQTASE